MKLNRIFLLGTLISTALMFTACSDDDDDYTWGKPAGTSNVTFAADQRQVLDFSATSLTVSLQRPASNSASAITVPIEVVDKPDFVTVPSEVTFAAGDSVATIDIAIGEGMQAFTNYELKLRIPEEYTNPYADQESGPLANIIFLKEDYKTYATGVYNAQILWNDQWPVEIQYSEMQDLYRIKDVITEGYDWYFHWNGPNAEEQEFWFTDSEGKQASVTLNGTKYQGVSTGYNHATYGMIYACVIDGYFIGYDPEAVEFDFPLAYRVTAGPFGSNYEWIDQLEFAN